jgi:hypothetical protein
MASKTNIDLITSQLPEFVVSDYPRFIEFLQAYYEFLQKYNVKVERIRDVDAVADDMVFFLRQEFASRFPNAVIDNRKLIKIVRSLYRAKGTLNAIEMLFRIFFNEAIVVHVPGKNILRASDGRWDQISSLTLERQFGDVDLDSQIVLRLENDSGTFFIDVERAERAGGDKVRFFFRNTYPFVYEDDQYIDIVDGVGRITYRGKLIKSPSTIRLINKGHSWRAGQVILVPGSTAPTITRVTRTGPGGTIESVEVVEFGYDHTENQTTIVSPYPTKPVGATYDYDYSLGGVIGGVPWFNHTLSLSSYVTQVSETLNGTADIQGGSAYFLENYVEPGYNSIQVLSQERNAPGYLPDRETITTDITLEEWLSSRSILLLEYDYIVNYKGSFRSDEGQLSNASVRLQDNYFYQMFSYVIESTRQVDEYRSVLNLIHPAGLKYFGELAKTSVVFANDVQAFRTFSQNKLYVNDALDAYDEGTSKHVVKLLTEIARTSDRITHFAVTKVLSEAPETVDTDTKHVYKVSNDIAVTSETTSRSVEKLLLDTGRTSDTTAFDVIKLAEDVAMTVDVVANAVTKPFTHTTDVSDVVTYNPTKVNNDVALVGDVTTQHTSKSLNEMGVAADVISIDVSNNLIDSATISDQQSRLVSKPVISDATAFGGQFINTTLTPYSDGSGTDDYFAEKYIIDEYNLFIG